MVQTVAPDKAAAAVPTEASKAEPADAPVAEEARVADAPVSPAEVPSAAAAPRETQQWTVKEAPKVKEEPLVKEETEDPEQPTPMPAEVKEKPKDETPPAQRGEAKHVSLCFRPSLTHRSISSFGRFGWASFGRSGRFRLPRPGRRKNEDHGF